MISSCWQILEIEATQDEQVIRKAYRKLLPNYHPETDPEGFAKLREAYENALKLAKAQASAAIEQTVDPIIDANQAKVDEVLASYKELLLDRNRRLRPEAWHQWIDEVLDQQPLAISEQVYWPILWETLTLYIHSHHCFSILSKRLNWQDRLLDLEPVTARDVGERLNHLAAPDLFDYSCLSHLPFEIQQDIIWFFETANVIAHNEPSHILQRFLTIHGTLYIPDNLEASQHICQWLCLAKIGSSSWCNFIEKQQANASTEELIDWQYWQATQYELLDRYEQALPLWISLVDELPNLEDKLLYYCQQTYLDYLPLLILALNKPLIKQTENWTLTSKTNLSALRMATAYSQATSPLAQDFINDHLEADCFAFSDNILRKDYSDNRTHKLYYYAWILKYGDESQLQLIAQEQTSSHGVIYSFIIERFKLQAEKLLALFATNETLQLVKNYLTTQQPNEQLNTLDFAQASTKKLINTWLFRLRWYTTSPLGALKKLGYIAEMPPSFVKEYLYFLQFIEHYQLAWLDPQTLPANSVHSSPIQLWQQLSLFIVGLLNSSNNHWLADHKQWLDTLPANTNHWLDDYLKAILVLPKKVIHNNWQEVLLDKLKPDSTSFCLFLSYRFSANHYFEVGPRQQNITTLVMSLLHQYSYYLLQKDLPEELILFCMLLVDHPKLTEQQQQQVMAVAEQLMANSYLANKLYKFRENNSADLKEHILQRLNTEQAKHLIDYWLELTNKKQTLTSSQINYLNALRDNADDSLLTRLTAESLLTYKKPKLSTKLSMAVQPKAKYKTGQDIPKDGLAGFFSGTGRIGRLEYVGHLILLLLLIVFCFVLSMLLTAASDGYRELYIAAGVIACCLRFYAITTRRLHDLGRSSKAFIWFAIIAIITKGIAIGVLCLLPGKKESNEHGPPPPPPLT